ncbi:MAG TPA: HAD-IIIA family hydrolase [Nocardioidaceae bacterium]|nr:HAD-IIIA family hydrolase [Nocardioidaceae bacterium]
MSERADGSSHAALSYAVVIPSVGRASLQRLLDTLAGQSTDTFRPAEVVVVDDRPSPSHPPLRPQVPAGVEWQPRVVVSGGRGPAAARNLGWQVTTAPWVAFLDDDVELPADWSAQLRRDLAGCDERTGASQARLRVPLPARRPTDWERNTSGLERALWATADMAYRRAALADVAGFDERFPRAYREDADLALRVRAAGWRLVRGERVTCHPVRPADDWVSVRVQAGNADDALMRRLHGPSWRRAADAHPGRFGVHLSTVLCATAALVAVGAGRSRTAALAASSWLALTAGFTAERLSPGPRPGEAGWAPEWRRMLLTSPVIPFAAVRARLAGEWRHRGGAQPWPLPVSAVLFDRDGTLVHDVPYNGDPSQVRVVDDAPAAIAALRRAGVKIGVISNQSGIGRGLVTTADVHAVNARIEAELGRFDTWQICPHTPEQRCSCRKPAPQLVRQAARELGVPVAECAVVGDIGTDVQAARAAGAQPVLVPTSVTLPDEVADAPVVVDRLSAAVDLLLRRARPARRGEPAAGAQR